MHSDTMGLSSYVVPHSLTPNKHIGALYLHIPVLYLCDGAVYWDWLTLNYVAFNSKAQ